MPGRRGAVVPLFSHPLAAASPGVPARLRGRSAAVPLFGHLVAEVSPRPCAPEALFGAQAQPTACRKPPETGNKTTPHPAQRGPWRHEVQRRTARDREQCGCPAARSVKTTPSRSALASTTRSPGSQRPEDHTFPGCPAELTRATASPAPQDCSSPHAARGTFPAV